MEKYEPFGYFIPGSRFPALTGTVTVIPKLIGGFPEFCLFAYVMCPNSQSFLFLGRCLHIIKSGVIIICCSIVLLPFLTPLKALPIFSTPSLFPLKFCIEIWRVNYPILKDFWALIQAE